MRNGNYVMQSAIENRKRPVMYLFGGGGLQTSLFSNNISQYWERSLVVSRQGKKEFK